MEATYILEGDGPLAFTCYEIMQTIVSAIEVANTPNVDIFQELVAYNQVWTISTITFTVV